ncbi:MAG: TerB family tellurite resistance protein [Alphaproteobacteria bacterium]|nr:TerB family tellurite resistance protein [Alphaproteobacteria bacterium]
MINRIKAFLDRDAGGTKDDGGLGETQVAAAALLVEAARMDDNFERSEWLAIRTMVGAEFGLSEEEAETLIAVAEEELEGSAEIYRFARIVKDRFEPEQRTKLIEMLWRVVYADGDLHDYEANLLRRVAGLIYVSDRDSGTARKKVLAEMSLAEQ